MIVDSEAIWIFPQTCRHFLSRSLTPPLELMEAELALKVYLIKRDSEPGARTLYVAAVRVVGCHRPYLSDS